MQVSAVDSHVTVVKGLEDSPFQIKLLPDGGQLKEMKEKLASCAADDHAKVLGGNAARLLHL